MTDNSHDYDWVVVGSGFGGSVSALRLAEKGYRVAVIECGRRFADEDFAERMSQLRRYLWMPKLGMKGILRLTRFRDVFIMSGSGVGGGSLVYAQTLYRAAPHFKDDWQKISGAAEDLDEYFTEAERMLGVTPHPRRTGTDRLMAEISKEIGAGDTFRPAPVGVYFGKPGVTAEDPYFGGEGPPRTGCISCGNCVLGCRYNAKNTLPKNYLWFAERLGVEIIPERQVTLIEPIDGADGRAGYRVSTRRSGAWFRKDRRTITAGAVVVAAGALGTNQLLARCKHTGALPQISDRLGHLVRTNSESIPVVTFPDDRGSSDSVAISGSIYPDDRSHVEATTPGVGSDIFSLMYTLLTAGGNRLTRPLKLLGQILRHPLRFSKTLDPRGWSRRTVFLPLMQDAEDSMQFLAKRTLFGRVRLTTKPSADSPTCSFLPMANEIAERVAEKTGGIAQSSLPEVFGKVMTAHILGGAVIAVDPSRGVADMHHRVFGYQNLLVCDGAAVPANLGVNPSLTITAMAERAMAAVPAKTTTREAANVAAAH
jgi:cholesterol oxidase